MQMRTLRIKSARSVFKDGGLMHTHTLKIKQPQRSQTRLWGFFRKKLSNIQFKLVLNVRRVADPFCVKPRPE